MALKTLLLILLSSANSFATLPCESVSNSKPEYDSQHKLTGCRLSSVEADSIYAKLGLKVGDLVKPEPTQGTKTMELYNSGVSDK